MWTVPLNSPPYSLNFSRFAGDPMFFLLLFFLSFFKKYSSCSFAFFFFIFYLLLLFSFKAWLDGSVTFFFELFDLLLLLLLSSLSFFSFVLLLDVRILLWLYLYSFEFLCWLRDDFRFPFAWGVCYILFMIVWIFSFDFMFDFASFRSFFLMWWGRRRGCFFFFLFKVILMCSLVWVFAFVPFSRFEFFIWSFNWRLSKSHYSSFVGSFTLSNSIKFWLSTSIELTSITDEASLRSRS